MTTFQTQETKTMSNSSDDSSDPGSMPAFIVGAIKIRATKVIVIDEFQGLAQSTSPIGARELTDWLRSLVEQNGASGPSIE